MHPDIEFTIWALTSLFTMINPVGVIPVYISLTANLDASDARRVAWKATLIAFTGKFIFDFFSISTDSLRIVGGIIFFLMGYDLLQARMERTKASNETRTEFIDDIAITPLAIPLICGPGAITMVILLMKEAPGLAQKSILIGSILAIGSVTAICLLGGRAIMRFLGANGNKVLMRIMGLIVMMIAVEFFFAGLKPKVQEMLAGQ